MKRRIGQGTQNSCQQAIAPEPMAARRMKMHTIAAAREHAPAPYSTGWDSG